MNLRRVAVLVASEVTHGSKTFIFIFAVVTPIVASLLVSLLFGRLFAEKPRLGIYDEGTSQLSASLTGLDFIESARYGNDASLMAAVEQNAIDVGLALPVGFDNNLAQNTEIPLKMYISGESLLKNRVIVTATIGDLITTLAGRKITVGINTVTLGEGSAASAQERLLPFIVMLTVFLGSTMVPATSIINEKQHGTIKALTATPTTLGEVYLAKGIFGAILGTILGTTIFILNQAVGPNPILLFVLMMLNAICAAVFGVLLGTIVKDVTTLFALIKGMGIILYAPVLIALFPQLPQWLAQIFPTFYMIDPVISVALRGAGLAEIAMQLVILAAIGIVLWVITMTMIERVRYQPV